MSDQRDPVYQSDRGTGSTPPETAAESANVVGRPPAAVDEAGFHAPEETAERERRPFSGAEAVHDGGSFDGLGLPTADDPA